MTARFLGRPWAVAVVLLAATLTVYLSRLLLTGEPYLAGGDTVPTRLLPVSLLTEGNFDLDEFFDLRDGDGCPYFLKHVGGHYYSTFPVGGPILLTLPYAALDGLGIDVLHNDDVRQLAAGALAACLSALSVLVVFLTYAPRGPGRALAVALVYAFGTGVWPTCAQDLWQHTFGVLFMGLSLYALERGHDDPRRLGWVGLPAGLLFFVRPGNALLVAVLAAAVTWRRPRQLALFAALGAPFLAFTLWYNFGVFHNVFGGYNNEAHALRPLANLARGLPGLLVSPARGLFVYSPVLLLGGLALVRPAEAGRRTLPFVLAVLIGVQLLMYGSYGHWYGGYCFGPRFLLETMPAAAGLLWYAWPRVTAGWPGRAAFAAAALWSVLANGTGYVYGWGEWCGHPDLDRCRARLWDWRDCPLVCAACGLPPHCPHPLRPGGPTLDVEGVGVELGHGWTERDGLWVVGDEAELLFHWHGRPAGQVRLVAWAEPGLPGPQEVVARLNGRECARATLSADEPRELRLPVGPADLARSPTRLTLHFTQYRRRSVWELCPFAAQLLAVQVGFW